MQRKRAFNRSLELFAATPPGFEEVAAGELASLGLAVGTRHRGGVSFFGDWVSLRRANLWCRVPSRILLRLRTFNARTFDQLERGLGDIPWDEYVAPNGGAQVRVSKRATKLYHTGKVAGIVADRIDRRVGSSGDNPPMTIVFVRIDGEEVTVSVDTSGELLHKRSYRMAGVDAPLRENLAAGLLMIAGYDSSEPLVDPLCGSGTFGIEAALIALGMPPGGDREFGFERFPIHDEKAWLNERAGYDAPAMDVAPIYCSDADPCAVAATAKNARAAGVGDLLMVGRCQVDELEPVRPGGLLVANPPYGVRIKGAKKVYSDLGAKLKGRFSSYRWGIITASGRAQAWLNVAPKENFVFRSGGLGLNFIRGGPEESNR